MKVSDQMFATAAQVSTSLLVSKGLTALEGGYQPLAQLESEDERVSFTLSGNDDPFVILELNNKPFWFRAGFDELPESGMLFFYCTSPIQVEGEPEGTTRAYGAVVTEKMASSEVSATVKKHRVTKARTAKV